MSNRTATPKKVRLACHRCRVRRIKCDGQVPACTNCAKAGQACLDVDGQNSDVVIPRNFAGAARARIQWLESIIRDRLPDVDLQAGPQVEPGPAPDAEGLEVSPQTSLSTLEASQASRKRLAEEPGHADDDTSFPERAHTVAMNLGMLSLNSDSPQKHYLGSSSGLLFTTLIGASPPSVESTPQDSNANTGGGLTWHDEALHRDSNGKYYRALIALLKQELPSKHDALTLTHTYVRWMHPDTPFLEPSSLFEAINAFYAFIQDPSEYNVMPLGFPSTMPSFRWNGRQVDPGAAEEEGVTMSVIAFILFMVLNIGALVQVRSRVYEFPPQKYYRAALQFSRDAFAQTSLSSIQALMMLVVHSMMTPSEVNLWTLVHLGLAYCVELGIHREPTQILPHDFAIQQVRRYTFFTIYSLDRSISSIQGRPLGFRDETFDVQLPQPPLPDERDIGGAVPESFAAAVNHYSNYRFRLDRIVSDIKLHLYHLPTDSSWFPWPQDPTEHQKRIKQTLESWGSDISRDIFDFPCLDDRQREVWKLKQKILFHSTMVLLFQPSQVVRKPSPEALKVCFDSASCILTGYQRLHDIQSLHMGWRSVQNIFAAGATLIYSFWTSQLVQKNASLATTSKDLRTCSNLLTIGGEWWPSAKNGQRSFESVTDLTMRKLYLGDAGSSKAPRLSLPASHLEHERRTGVELHENQEHAVSTRLDQGNIQPAESLDQLPPGQSEDSWQGLGGAVPDQALWHAADQGLAYDPEIEMFLADFDNSEFTWSFPLNSSSYAEQSGMPSHPRF